MLNKTIRNSLIISGVLLFGALGFSMYKWFDYKHKYDEISSRPKTLKPRDCLAITGDSNTYYQFNTDYYGGWYGVEDETFTYRDYLLYMYIFAIRDSNSSAACEFATYYLNDVENHVIEPDTVMLRVAERLLLQVVQDVRADPEIRILSACNLSYIYHGDYMDSFADSLLYRQYRDSVEKKR